MVMALTFLKEAGAQCGKLQLKVAKTFLSLLFRFVSIINGFSNDCVSMSVCCSPKF